jgi:serine/threonine-protein phosphatase 2A activator
MYNAEVLSKFPVVQHFPFGSLFAWEKDPNAKIIQASVHTSSQPVSSTVPTSTSSTSAYSSPRPQPQQQLRDPMAESLAHRSSVPAARTTQQAHPSLRDPLASSAGTAAPWAKAGATAHQATGPNVPSGPNQPTRAPWVSRTPAVLPHEAGAGAGTTMPWAQVKREEPEARTKAPWANRKS